MNVLISCLQVLSCANLDAGFDIGGGTGYGIENATHEIDIVETSSNNLR